MQSIISISNLSKTYATGFKALSERGLGHVGLPILRQPC